MSAHKKRDEVQGQDEGRSEDPTAASKPRESFEERMARILSETAALQKELVERAATVAPVTPPAKKVGRPLGSKNVPKVRPPAPAPEPALPKKPVTLNERIEEALTVESLEPLQLSRTLKESLERVTNALQTLRSENRIYNVGMGDDPKWTWVIGNETDTPTLRKTIVKLICERPMEARQIANATGATMGRVNGQLVEIIRMPGVKMLDLGGGGHTKYYFMESGRSVVMNYEQKRKQKPKVRK